MNRFEQLLAESWFSKKPAKKEPIQFLSTTLTNSPDIDDNLFEKHAPDVTHIDHRDMINYYTGNSSPMNKHLWRKKFGTAVDNSYLDKNADKISDILKTAPAAKKDLVVYSGVNGERNALHKGDLHIPAFTSSSSDSRIASGFAHSRHTVEDLPNADGDIVPHKVHHMIKIHIKKGQQVGAYVAEHSNYSDEKEFLINKNHTLHLDGTHEDHRQNDDDHTKNTYFRIHNATITPEE